ncbi:MAG TPA: hypothetical protein DFS52_08680 [Myxococcales bacterium]|jgi:hypothetical protein|nr:hypothetical protein [Myxococcales bacterium]
MSTAEERERLIKKGKNEPVAGLVDQGEYTTGITNEHKLELTAGGVSEEKFGKLSTSIAKVAALMAARREFQVDSMMATNIEREAICDAKEHIFKMRNLVPMVIRDTKANDLTAVHLAPAGTLGRSSTKILGYLKTSRNLVARLEAGLAPYFGGESPTAVHDKVTQALTDAQRGQETKREGLTPEATDLYEAKGELLEIIEDLNRIGRVVFRGRAEIAAKFNKDILLRARRRTKTAKDAGEVTGAEAEQKVVGG